MTRIGLAHASTGGWNTGSITLNTGATVTKEAGTLPANVKVSETKGGKVFFGKVSLTALSPENALNATGRDIIFSGDTVNSITLGGGVSMTAADSP